MKNMARIVKHTTEIPPTTPPTIGPIGIPLDGSGVAVLAAVASLEVSEGVDAGLVVEVDADDVDITDEELLVDLAEVDEVDSTGVEIVVVAETAGGRAKIVSRLSFFPQAIYA